MASYKIITDEALKIPVAVPSYVAGELITETFNNKSNGPSANPTTAKSVKTAPLNPAKVKMSVIDVVGNYDWKVSPNSDIVEHPYIILKEYRIHKSPLLAQLSYTVKAGNESLAANIRAVTSVFGILKSIANLAEGLQEALEGIVDKVEGETGAGAVDEELKDILKPFQGLYYLKPTNFTYKLPYFSRKMLERTSNWDRQYSGDGGSIENLIIQGVDFVATRGAGVPILGAFAEPGLYIERPRYFQTMPGQDPISVKFPLLNTLNSESIQKNFNLIWLLCFQNSSIRQNKTDVFPPCIYRVLIPGVRFLLYASIQNVTVEYIGTRRRMPIVHPATGETIDVIIPEAYNVELTINNLTTECGNFLLKSLTNNL